MDLNVVNGLDFSMGTGDAEGGSSANLVTHCSACYGVVAANQFPSFDG